MADFDFVQATREQAMARVALAGPSGSGKTMTGLILATRLAEGRGPVAVIDTERGSASKYAAPPNTPDPLPAGLFRFERLNMYAYDPRDLIKALAAASKRGFPSVLIDSLSRFWSGKDGMLEFVDNVSRRNYGGNTWGGGWKEARPIENDMIEAMLGYPGHVIVTMRTKTHYDVTKVDGKTVPVKIGLQPEQRQGIEYEFDVVGDMDPENNLVISKSRCPDLTGRVINRPDYGVAEMLLAWLATGEAGRTPNDYRNIAINPLTTQAELQALYRTVHADGKLGATVMDERGELVTLHDLIARKGREISDARRAAEQAQAAAEGSQQEPAGAGQPAAAPAGDSVPGDDEKAWVVEFVNRLAETGDDVGIDARKLEVSRAMAEQRIMPATASQLYADISIRGREIRSAA